MRTLLISLLLVSVAAAAEMEVIKDVPYARPVSERHTLDVYSPKSGKNHPVIVWLHGGAWRFGNKRSIQEKPEAFVDQGFVFVSANYRFVPEVTMDKIAADVAKVVRWTYDHIGKHGGSRRQIFIAGHSAGAHLSALVATDEKYLKAEGLKLSDLKGCIPVDTAMYDAARQIKERGPRRSRIYTAAFGSEVETQKEFSPLLHVAKGKGIPPFLILHVASRADSTAQSQDFAKALREADVTATLAPGKDKTHSSINHELGLPEDEPTKAVFEFLDELTK